jgi:hypothetical protein
MSIINFEPEDAMSAVTMDPAVYPCIITDLTSAISSTQKSTNYFAKFKITGGKYLGKVMDVIFNTKTTPPFSFMGTMQFLPHSKLLQVQAAQNGSKVEPVKQALDTDKLVNKPFCVQIGFAIDPKSGSPLNALINFLPVGADKEVKSDESVPF